MLKKYKLLMVCAYEKKHHSSFVLFQYKKKLLLLLKYKTKKLAYLKGLKYV